MSASDESNTQQESARSREAIADVQERLAQVGRLLGRVRDGSPEQHAQALGRIEEGIESLTERIAAFGQDGEQPHAPADAAPEPARRSEADNPWDPQSAEELMRAYELADTQFTGDGQEGSTPRYRHWAQDTEVQAAHGLPPHDAAWLEARFADIAALLQRVLADNDPARSLVALDGRLDQFERRLDSALSEMALFPTAKACTRSTRTSASSPDTSRRCASSSAASTPWTDTCPSWRAASRATRREQASLLSTRNPSRR